MPEDRSETRCIFKNCTNSGVPEPGYKFFVCDACFDRLDECLWQEYTKRLKRALDRHRNN